MYSSATQEKQAAHWQFAFCQTAESVAPEVWATLEIDVFPIYQLARADPEADRYMNSLQGQYTLHKRINPQITPPVFQRLSTLLQDWQRKWNLFPDWCELEALHLMSFWALVPEDAGKYVIGRGWGGRIPHLPQPVLPQWDVWTTWGDYENKVFKILKEYRDKSLRELEEQGWTPPNYGRAGAPEKHLRWLALAVLKNLTPEQIEEIDGLSGSVKDRSDTIKKGIRSASKGTGLPVPRRPKRG